MCVSSLLPGLESNTLVYQRIMEKWKSQDSVFGNSLIHTFLCFLVLAMMMMMMRTMMMKVMMTLTVECGRTLKCVNTCANSLHVIFIIHEFGYTFCIFHLFVRS